jgi:hypothetical protein
MRDEGEKRENVPVDWMNELKKEDNYTRSPRNRKRKKRKKTSLVLQEPELRLSIADGET